LRGICSSCFALAAGASMLEIEHEGPQQARA
jgi:hypothetical protein